jgi:hypothetical protein
MSSGNQQFLSLSALAWDMPNNETHLSSRHVLWRTVLEQPDTCFWEQFEVMLDIIVARTSQDIGQERHCPSCQP